MLVCTSAGDKKYLPSFLPIALCWGVGMAATCQNALRHEFQGRWCGGPRACCPDLPLLKLVAQLLECYPLGLHCQPLRGPRLPLPTVRDCSLWAYKDLVTLSHSGQLGRATIAPGLLWGLLRLYLGLTPSCTAPSAQSCFCLTLSPGADPKGTP